MLLMVLLATGTYVIGYAQNPTDDEPGDPGGMAVTTVQNMSFGAFTQGASGGTVTLSTTGERSISGTVIPLNMGVMHFQAIFEIDAPQGSIISIINGPDATLAGSNGGSMSLKIGTPSPVSPFAIVEPQPVKTQVHVGGILTVGNSTASPPGLYSGTIYITFNQE